MQAKVFYDFHIWVKRVKMYVRFLATMPRAMLVDHIQSYCIVMASGRFDRLAEDALYRRFQHFDKRPKANQQTTVGIVHPPEQLAAHLMVRTGGGTLTNRTTYTRLRVIQSTQTSWNSTGTMTVALKASPSDPRKRHWSLEQMLGVVSIGMLAPGNTQNAACSMLGVDRDFVWNSTVTLTGSPMGTPHGVFSHDEIFTARKSMEAAVPGIGQCLLFNFCRIMYELEVVMFRTTLLYYLVATHNCAYLIDKIPRIVNRKCNRLEYKLSLSHSLNRSNQYWILLKILVKLPQSV